jgi:D-alanine-D-alanine ligase
MVTVNVVPGKIPVILIYNINPEWSEEEKKEAVCASEQLGQALKEVGHRTICLPIENVDLENRLSKFDPYEYIVFNWCEILPGIIHSEWMVAEKLEKLGFIFTGADSQKLLLSQDKNRVKEMLRQSGIPTPEWALFTQPTDCRWEKYPAIIKPVNEHCSEGIDADSVVLSPEEARARIDGILEKYQQPVLMEDFVDGREFHVAVWGNEKLEVLPAVEMDFSYFKNVKERLCSYEAKFIAGSKHYEKIETLVPAPLSKKELNMLNKVCEDAYSVTGCRDYARFDVRLRNGIFYILDVNHNADISLDASMACAAQAAGLSYGEMVSNIVCLAAKRHSVWGKIT